MANTIKSSGEKKQKLKRDARAQMQFTILQLTLRLHISLIAFVSVVLLLKYPNHTVAHDQLCNNNIAKHEKFNNKLFLTFIVQFFLEF